MARGSAGGVTSSSQLTGRDVFATFRPNPFSKEAVLKINRINVHASVTQDRVMDAVTAMQTSLDNIGFCILCGCESEGVEPDARNYTCESCGAQQIFGAEELLMEMAV